MVTKRTRSTLGNSGFAGSGPTEAEFSDSEFSDSEFSEAELTELALGADRDQPVHDDAVPIHVYLGQSAGLLPSWYMPAPMARSGGRWRLPVVLVIVGAFLVIEAMGLCSTFGSLVPA